MRLLTSHYGMPITLHYTVLRVNQLTSNSKASEDLVVVLDASGTAAIHWDACLENTNKKGRTNFPHLHEMRAFTELHRTHVLVKYNKKVVQEGADVCTVLLTRGVQHHTETLNRISTNSNS